MRAAIMQPYFFPYLGYFELAAAGDVFILYDNIKYTKKGWINPNKVLRNGQAAVFSLPLKNDPDILDIRDRRISKDFDKRRLLNQFREAYRCAPYFDDAFGLFESVVMAEEPNLFEFLHNSITATCRYLGIRSSVVVSSELEVDPALKGSERIIGLPIRHSTIRHSAIRHSRNTGKAEWPHLACAYGHVF